MTVVAYSFHGDYTDKHPQVVRALLRSIMVCPMWTPWVYVGTDCPQASVSCLELLGAKVIRADGCSVLDKLRALDDQSVDVAIVRDIHVDITQHEKVALDEWLASDDAVCMVRHTPGLTMGVKRRQAATCFSVTDQTKAWDDVSANGYTRFTEQLTQSWSHEGVRNYWCLPCSDDRPCQLAVVIMSSDRNPYYLDFWPVVSKIWREVVNVAPVLVIVDKEGPPVVDGHGLVLHYELVDGVPTHLQAQNARVHAATLFGDITVMTSDIDMMPMQASYFHAGLSESSSGPVAMCANAYPGQPRFPLCYLVATGHSWKCAIKPGAWPDYVHMLNGLYPEAADGHDNKWSIDELYTSKCLIDYGVKRLANWSEPLGLRCDRSYWAPDYTKIANHEMVDAHLPRPHSQFRRTIKLVSSTLLDQSAHWPVRFALQHDATAFFECTNWDNHRPLLWFALQATSTGHILELGAGLGSTPLLAEYGRKTGRPVFTYDSKEEWARQFGVEWVNDWDAHGLWEVKYSVALVDHAPGEHRYLAIQRLATTTNIIVIHDSEPGHAGYMLDRVWPLFKHKVNLRRADREGAWASAVSNSLSFKHWSTTFSSGGIQYVIEVER